MMFMIPIPPTISEIAAIAASTPLKMFFVCCSLLQEQLGHADLEVDHLVVPRVQHALHARRRRPYLVRVVHAHDHAVELVVVVRSARCSASSLAVAFGSSLTSRDACCTSSR